MSPEQIEQFRICILQQLRAVGAEASLPAATLANGAKLAGFSHANEDVVRSAMAYLTDKQLVAAATKTISPENRRWRITAAGTDFLAEQGL